MSKKISVRAFVANGKIDLFKVQETLKFGQLIRKEPSYLIFQKAENQFLYVKNYGGIVHFNINQVEVAAINASIIKENPIQLASFEEKLTVRLSHDEVINASFDELVIPELSLDLVHIICLNLSQSVSLFLYQNLCDRLLDQTKIYTSQLEQKGSVSLKRKKLMKFIGAALNLKNEIAVHLYIFDTPTMAWEDQTINKVDRLLKEDLEIQYRYNAIKEQLNIVKENLDHFKDVNLHQHSSTLEWIIIVLILFEVIHVLLV